MLAGLRWPWKALWRSASLLSLPGLAHAGAPFFPEKDWSYLENGQVRIGVYRPHGAAVGYFAEVASGQNLLDHADAGRYLQQSYYGGLNGATWNNQPWSFNPVQGGDAFHNPSQVLAFRNDGKTLYARTRPKDWALNNVETPCEMEEWITLSGKTAKIHFRFIYHGQVPHRVSDQEVPAFFVRPGLKHLVYYDGPEPWLGRAVRSLRPPTLNAQPMFYFKTTEGWAAYVDDAGQGVGIANRSATTGVAYVCWNCSYLALTNRFALTPGKVHEYDVYMHPGTVAELRKAFYALAGAGQALKSQGCTDTPPDNRYTCAQQAGWGKCDEPWMQGFCLKSCGLCP